MSIREVRVQRVSVVSAQPFDQAVARIDEQIGHPDMVAFRKSFAAARNEAEMEKVVEPVTRPNGIMEFHGSTWVRFSGKRAEPRRKNSAHCCGKSAHHEGDGEARS